MAPDGPETTRYGRQEKLQKMARNHWVPTLHQEHRSTGQAAQPQVQTPRHIAWGVRSGHGEVIKMSPVSYNTEMIKWHVFKRWTMYRLHVFNISFINALLKIHKDVFLLKVMTISIFNANIKPWISYKYGYQLLNIWWICMEIVNL